MWRAMDRSSTSALPFARWAVTGGTGLVGNNLIRALVARGAEVTVLSRRPPRREFAGLAVREVEGDLDDAPALRRCFAGAEVVVHAAAMVEIRHGGRAEFENVNVEGTRAVLAALPEKARLLHVSTVDALGMRSRENPADEDTPPADHEAGVPYVDTKRAADRLVQASPADWRIVYPTYMFGPWDWRPSSGKMIREIAAGKGVFSPPGGNNFVDVRDVVDAMIVSVGKPRGGRWILGNENLTYAEAWAKIARITGRRAPMGALPSWVTGATAAALAFGERMGLREGEINSAAVKMSTLPHYFSPERARRELGLQRTPVSEAIAEAWRWFGEGR